MLILSVSKAKHTIVKILKPPFSFLTPLNPPQKHTKPKSYHKKLDKKREKIDKNETFILQHRPGNHIVAINQQQLL